MICSLRDGCGERVAYSNSGECSACGGRGECIAYASSGGEGGCEERCLRLFARGGAHRLNPRTTFARLGDSRQARARISQRASPEVEGYRREAVCRDGAGLPSETTGSLTMSVWRLKCWYSSLHSVVSSRPGTARLRRMWIESYTSPKMLARNRSRNRGIRRIHSATWRYWHSNTESANTTCHLNGTFLSDASLRHIPSVQSGEGERGIHEHYPNDHYIAGPATFFVATQGETTRRVADKLGFGMEDPNSTNGIVVPVTNYWGGTIRSCGNGSA